MNPFKYGCVVYGEFFCPRPSLENELRRMIASAQNVVVQGERRMGKTSLVCEAVRRTPSVKLLYIDLLGVKTISDFCRKVTAAVVSLDKSKGFLARTADMLRRLRPTLSIDPVSGSPTLSVDVAASSEIGSIEAVMDMLAVQAKAVKACVVFDEFQDMLNLKESEQVFATLRGKIQFQGNVPYVFLGSVRNQMSNLFTNSRSPFFKSAIIFDVGRICDDDFIPFLKKRFTVGKRSIDDATLREVLNLADHVSGDVQELCDALWSSTKEGAKIAEASIDDAIKLVFSREEKSYIPILSHLTAIQVRILRGLVQFGGKKPLSSDFLQGVNVSNAATVRKSLLRMVELDILYQYDDEYKFTNPFFKRWLIAQ